MSPIRKSAMVNQDNRNCSALHSTRAKMKVRFLPTEEAVKLKSGSNATTNVKRGYESSTNAYELHPANVKRTCVAKETATRNSGNSLPPVRRTSHSKAHLRQGPQHYSSKMVKHNSTRLEDRPGRQDVPAVKAKPSSSDHEHRSISHDKEGEKCSRSEDRPGRPDVPAVNAKPRSSDHEHRSISHDKEGEKCCRSEDRPGRPDVPAVNAKPRSSDHEHRSISHDKEGEKCCRSEDRHGRPDVPAAKPRSSDHEFRTTWHNKETKGGVKDKNDWGQKREKGGTCDCPMVRGSNLQDTSSKSQAYLPNLPNLEVVWRGSFEVLDIASDSQLCEGFLAHCPKKVSRKAYEFSKQIAGVLQFKMHPRRDFWTEIFQTESPGASDIGLYFFPGNFERSRRKYANLLKFIEKHDLVLRTRMGYVELLVFGSTHLHAVSQKLDGSFFMWGVFRRLKARKVT